MAQMDLCITDMIYLERRGLFLASRWPEIVNDLGFLPSKKEDRCRNFRWTSEYQKVHGRSAVVRRSICGTKLQFELDVPAR